MRSRCPALAVVILASLWMLILVHVSLAEYPLTRSPDADVLYNGRFSDGAVLALAAKQVGLPVPESAIGQLARLLGQDLSTTSCLLLRTSLLERAFPKCRTMGVILAYGRNVDFDRDTNLELVSARVLGVNDQGNLVLIPLDGKTELSPRIIARRGLDYLVPLVEMARRAPPSSKQTTRGTALAAPPENRTPPQLHGRVESSASLDQTVPQPRMTTRPVVYESSFSLDRLRWSAVPKRRLLDSIPPLDQKDGDRNRLHNALVGSFGVGPSPVRDFLELPPLPLSDPDSHLLVFATLEEASSWYFGVTVAQATPDPGKYMSYDIQIVAKVTEITVPLNAPPEETQTALEGKSFGTEFGGYMIGVGVERVSFSNRFPGGDSARPVLTTVEGKITVRKAVLPSVTAAPASENPVRCVADQLGKLKELRDAGILTEEEYQTKRKHLVDKL